MRLRKRRGIDVKTHGSGAYVRDRHGYTTSPRSWASNTTYCLVGSVGTLGPQMALCRVIEGKSSPVIRQTMRLGVDTRFLPDRAASLKHRRCGY